MQIPHDIVLLAANDWWQILGGIIVFVLYGLGQLMSARDELKKKAQPRPPRPARPQPQPGPPNAGGAPPNQADPLRAEVEEFLRRAQGRPAEAPRPRQQPPPARQMPPRRPVPEAVSRPGKPVPPPARQPIRSSEPVTLELRGEGVAEHVARHVTAEVQAIAEQTRKLGADVAQADDRMESHLQAAFQHQVGTLQHAETADPAKRQMTAAEEIREAFRQPAGVRQLVIASEILRRPEERW